MGNDWPSRGRTNQPTTICADDLGMAFDQYGAVILAYCRRHAEDTTDSEDLMSVIFLEAWRCRQRAFVVDGTLAPWLFGVAKNVLRTSARSTRRHRVALARYAAANPEADAPDPAAMVAARVDAVPLRSLIIEAIEQLSEKDREVVRLCLLEDLPTAEAATVLGIPVGTVKSRLHHARQMLRRLLQTSESVEGNDPMGPSGHEESTREIRARKAKVS